MKAIGRFFSAIFKAIGRLFDGIVNLWESEPVAITGLIDSALVLAVSFGAPISPDQKLAIDGLLTALGIAIARKQVTPVAAPNLPSGTIVNVTTEGPKPDRAVVV